MSVEKILEGKGRTVFTVRPEHSVADACALLTTKKVGVAVVCDAKDRILGVISERDIVSGITQYGRGLLDMPVRNIMSSPVITCQPGDSNKKILELMTDKRIRHLPVVEGETLVGIVSIGDAVNYRLKEAQMEMGVLRDFAAVR